jgi:hypothetical protein
MATQTGSASFASVTGRPTQMGGATVLSQPSAVGSAGASGHTENCGGIWLTPPYQTFTGTFNLALWVDHQEGIDHIDIRVDGGPVVSVSVKSRIAPPAWLATIMASYGASVGGKADTSGKPIYVQSLVASDYTDGAHVAQAIAYPVSGVPLLVGDLHFNTNNGGTIPTTIKWAAPAGNDTTGDGSEALPYLTIGKAETVIGANGNNGFVYLKAGSYAYAGGTTATTSTGILTVQAAPGVALGDVVLTGFTFDKLPVVTHRRFKDVTFDGVDIALQSGSGTLWLDGCVGINDFQTDTSYTDVWTTNCYFHDVTSDFTLRGTKVHLNAVLANFSNDAFQGQWVVNYVVHAGGEGHSDVIQFGNEATTNAGAYGLLVSGAVRAQAVTNGCPLTDVMFRDCDFAAINIDNNLMIAQACRNMYFKDCVWGHDCFLLTVNANPFVATKVVFDNSSNAVFDPALNTINGVTVR